MGRFKEWRAALRRATGGWRTAVWCLAIFFSGPVLAAGPATAPVDRPVGLAIDPLARQVLVVDGNGRAEIRQIDLATRSVDTRFLLRQRASGFAFSPSSRKAVVTHEQSDEISIVDVDRGSIDVVGVGREPLGIAIDDSRNLAIVANGGDDTVSFVDLGSDEVMATVAIGERPGHVAIDPLAGMALVSRGKGDVIEIIDVNARAWVGSIAVDEGPGEMAVDAATRLLVVTHERLDQVSIIDLESGSVLARIPTGPSPGAVAIDEVRGRAAVANRKGDSVSLIDLGLQRIVATRAAGRSPLAIAMDPLGATVVIAAEDGTLVVVDPDATTTGSPTPVGRDPAGVAIHPARDLAVVVNRKGDSATLLGLPDGMALATIEVGNDPGGVAIDPLRELAAITLAKADAVALLDLEGAGVMETVPVGRDPHAIAIDAEAGIALVANRKDDSLSVVDLGTRAVTAVIPVGRDPRGLAIDPVARRAWVTLEKDGAVQIIDLQRREVVATVPVGRKPAGVALDGARGIVVVANEIDDSLSLIDMDSLAVVDTVSVGKGPLGVAIDGPAGAIYVTSRISDSAWAIDLDTQAVLKVYPTGKQPTAIALDGLRRVAMVTNRVSDDVTVIPLPAISPPVITVTFPPDHTLTRQPVLTITGRLDRASALTINGEPVSLDGDLGFEHDVALDEGANQVVLVARDAAGITGRAELTLYLDTEAPVAPLSTLIDIEDSGDGQVTVSGAAGSVEPLGLVRIENRRTGTTAAAVADAAGAFLISIAALPGDALAILVVDGAGNVGASIDMAVQPGPGAGLPPDPASVASPIDPAVVTMLGDAIAFLHQGSNPVQRDVAPDAIDVARSAWVQGRVTDHAGSPLAGVHISVHGHPRFGHTLSRADGAFDLVVNGGGWLTLEYRKSGHLPVQRRVRPHAQGSLRAPDVRMIGLDPAVTTVLLAPNGPLQVARGSVVSDADGERRATLMFAPGTRAEMVLRDGTRRPLSTLNVRATEYTVGTGGPAAMPGELPASSGYTYAVELSVDEAIAADATEVTFDRPVAAYVENFLGFPVGGVVPSGWYDRDRSAWIPSRNGRVIRLLSITNGVADLDLDGSGLPADEGALGAIGIGVDERRALGELYGAGQSLWRVPVGHFTPWDYNWPYGPPPDARPPAQPAPIREQREERPDCRKGSVIECQNLTLRKSLPVSGTTLSLGYASDRVPGRQSAYVMTIPLSGSTIPPSVKRIELHIDIAGRHFFHAYPPAPNQEHVFDWDGMDAFGRRWSGSATASVRIGYVYETTYQEPAEFEQSFALLSGIPITGSTARQEVTLWQEHHGIPLGVPDARGQGFGGWALDVHHAYDALTRTLYRGDGLQRSLQETGDAVTTLIGAGEGSHETVDLNYPHGIAVDPDGGIYVSDGHNSRVLYVSPEGAITTAAGMYGHYGSGGDGGPATAAQLGTPRGLALGPDGSLFIADADTHRVRRVGADGIILTVAGNGLPEFTGDGVSAIQTGMAPDGVAVTGDGTLYIADSGNNRIYRVGTDGIVTTVAGTGVSGFSGDGGPAILARLAAPTDVAVAADGALYIVDWFNHRVRRVDPNGIIRTVAGSGLTGFTPVGALGDGGPATSARLRFPSGIALADNGGFFISDTDHHRIRHVDEGGRIRTFAGGVLDYFGDGAHPLRTGVSVPGMIALSADGALYVVEGGPTGRVRRVGPVFPGIGHGDNILVSDDGSELYVFSRAGRHIRTLDAITGATRYAFSYDAQGALGVVSDGDGNSIRIERSGQGITLVAPDGQRTVLTLDANGYLSSATGAAGGVHLLVYDAGGLLREVIDPRGNATTYDYDASGRLARSLDAAGGGWTLSRSAESAGYETTLVSAEGRVSRFRVEALQEGTLRTRVLADGTVESRRTGASGERLMVTPDGTRHTTSIDPDPRFGMAAPVPAISAIVTPGGLRNEVTVARSALLDDPSDVLSHIEFEEVTTWNGRPYVARFAGTDRVWTFTTPEGRTSTLIFDGHGRVVHRQEPGMAPVEFRYDERGRLSAMIAQATPEEVRIHEFGYGPDGHLDEIIDPLGRVQRLEHDADGRLLRQWLPDGRSIAFGVDANGNLTSLTPPGRAPHAFEYGARDLAEGYSPPEVPDVASATRYRYDLDGLLVGIDRPDGQSIDLAYDAAARLAAISLPHGPYSYTYQAETGQLAHIAAPDGIASHFAWDGPLPMSETTTGEIVGIVSNQFDDNFRRVGVAVNGDLVTWDYDGDGLVSTAGSLVIERDRASGRVTAARLGQIETSIAYNGFGEPIAEETSFAGEVVRSVSWDRDASGRIVRRDETIAGVTDSEVFTYDAAGRLSASTRAGVTTRWGYDQNGNRTHVDGVEIGTYDEQDRLLGWGAVSYGHAAGGERARRIEHGATTVYDYDALGNLRRVILPGDVVIEYLIDGLNRRVGKKIDGALVQGFLYQDQLNPAAELDGNGDVVSRFIYADRPNVPAYMIRDGNTYRILSDHVGSPRLVIDAGTGEIVQRIDYDAWGNILEDTNPGFQPFGFAGGLYDPHTGLLRFGARDYDPQTGRWTSKDPIGFAGGDTNLYGYVVNDPVNYFDSDGLLLLHAVGGVLGGVTGGLVAAATGQSVATATLNGAIAGVGIGGGFLGNSIMGMVSGLAAYYMDNRRCELSAVEAIKAAGLGALGGILGRELGLSNGLAVVRAGEGAGQILGRSSAITSAYYAQTVGGGLIGGLVSAAGR